MQAAGREGGRFHFCFSFRHFHFHPLSAAHSAWPCQGSVGLSWGAKRVFFGVGTDLKELLESEREGGGQQRAAGLGATLCDCFISFIYVISAATFFLGGDSWTFSLTQQPNLKLAGNRRSKCLTYNLQNCCLCCISQSFSGFLEILSLSPPREHPMLLLI